MHLDTYPKLGSKVSFIRFNHNSKAVETGEGIVLGLGLDVAKRPTAHVKVGEEGINIQVSALNPTDEFKEKFANMVEAVKVVELEGNEKVKETVAEYNSKVGALEDEVLGVGIVVEE